MVASLIYILARKNHSCYGWKKYCIYEIYQNSFKLFVIIRCFKTSLFYMDEWLRKMTFTNVCNTYRQIWYYKETVLLKQEIKNWSKTLANRQSETSRLLFFPILLQKCFLLSTQILTEQNRSFLCFSLTFYHCCVLEWDKYDFLLTCEHFLHRLNATCLLLNCSNNNILVFLKFIFWPWTMS